MFKSVNSTFFQLVLCYSTNITSKFNKIRTTLNIITHKHNIIINRKGGSGKHNIFPVRDFFTPFRDFIKDCECRNIIT